MLPFHRDSSASGTEARLDISVEHVISEERHRFGHHVIGGVKALSRHSCGPPGRVTIPGSHKDWAAERSISPGNRARNHAADLIPSPRIT